MQMRQKENKTRIVGMALVVVVAAVFGFGAFAGKLEPDDPPGPTMHTLDEIYTKLESTPSASNDSMPSHRDPGAWASINMELTGENQGNIEGSCEQHGREGTIVILGYEHRVHIPLDAQSGLPSGKRIHSPLTVVKTVDKATPKLYRALSTGERMTEVTVKFYSIDQMGQEAHYYTVKLEDAIIVDIRACYPRLESVSLTYSRIIWTWEPDGIESQDDWRSSRP